MITRSDFIRPRIFPIAVLTTFLMIGIWWQSHAYPLPYAIYTYLITAIIASLFNYFAKFTEFYFIVLCALTTVAGAYRFQMLVDHQKNFQHQTNGKTYTVMGKVVDSIKTANQRLPQRITLRIISLDDTVNPIFPQADLYLYTQRLRGIRIDDTIIIKEVLFKHTYTADFNSYLLKENVAATVVLQNHEIRKIARPFVSPWRRLYYLRKEVAERCQQKLHPTAYLYFSSIFLGSPETKKMIDPIKQRLQQWGIVHYLARSGLHVVIFIMFWQLLLRFLPIAFFAKELLLIILCIIYALLSWPSIPFHRALFTFLITRCCTLVAIRVYYLPILALVTFATLLINPTFLFSLDFQLSFGITAALAWYNEIQSNYRAKR